MPQHLACTPGDRASYAHLTDEGRSPGKASCPGGRPDAAWTDSPARPVPARRPPCGTTSHHLAGEKAQLFPFALRLFPPARPAVTGGPGPVSGAAQVLCPSFSDVDWYGRYTPLLGSGEYPGELFPQRPTWRLNSSCSKARVRPAGSTRRPARVPPVGAPRAPGRGLPRRAGLTPGRPQGPGLGTLSGGPGCSWL